MHGINEKGPQELALQADHEQIISIESIPQEQ
jgi:hypothetical protein